ncbi:MAG: hypothetical protein IKR92_04025 [Alphaproteobacteria bacterium]|nr:hypothetical protein [Alphaproteobacteria bacterium]
MDFGYKTLLALTLATAACFRVKAQNTDSEKKQNLQEVTNTRDKSVSASNEGSISFFDARKNYDPSSSAYLETEDTSHVTSAWVEHPSFEEEVKMPDIKPKSQLIAPNVLAKDNVTPWENTPEGIELMQTWIRLQQENGNYNELKPEDVQNLQKISNTSHRFCALEAGLKNYEMDGEDMLRANTDSIGVELEKAAGKEATGSGSFCYRWMKHILMGLIPIAYMEGDYAREAAEWLEKCPNVVGTRTTFIQMDKLVPGAVAVFGKGPGAEAGHILISGAGDRKMLKEYETEWGQKYWYSPARDISDKIRPANVTGNRGKNGHYAPKPKVFFTKNSMVSDVTILKVGYQYTRENSSQMFINTQDVYNSILKINTKSAELAANKIIEAQKEVDGFVKAENQTAYHKYPSLRAEKPRASNRKLSKRKTSTRRTAHNRSRGRGGWA